MPALGISSGGFYFLTVFRNFVILVKSISEIMSYKTIPRWIRRLGGLFFMLLAGGFWGWGWYTAINKGYYYQKASMFFPAVFILGLGMLMFPGYKEEERIARGEDISVLSRIKLLPPRWRVILAVALIAGFGNYIIMSIVFS
jgi:hypothetical protein